MRNIRAIGFLALFCCVTAGNFRCFDCPNVLRNNRCSVPEKECITGNWGFCYTRQQIKSGSVQVDRGCTNRCINFVRKRQKMTQISLCCVQELCNNHDFWTNTK